MVVALIVAGVLAVAGLVAYKLWKSGKAVTGASVVAGVEADVKSEAAVVKTDVVDAVAKDVTKS